MTSHPLLTDPDDMMDEISCTIAVVTDADSFPATHMTQILVMEGFLGRRAGVLTIATQTLVSLVRMAVSESPSRVPAVVSSTLQSTAAVDLATTRVPFFEKDWQATSYGF